MGPLPAVFSCDARASIADCRAVWSAAGAVAAVSLSLVDITVPVEDRAVMKENDEAKIKC